jgi:putative oxidoreductase
MGATRGIVEFLLSGGFRARIRATSHPSQEERAMDMLFGTFASKSLLIVRVVFGVIFFAHGGQKVFGWFGGPGLRGVVNYFKQSLGVPAPLSVLAALTECVGGLAMIVGLLVRPAAVGLIVVMLVAIATVHWRNGFFLNWSLEPGKGHGFEMNLALIGMALAVLVGGGGTLSLDRLIHPW